MKTKLTLAALALVAALSAPAVAHAKWYSSHDGAKLCVPLDNYGERSEQVYYGTGFLHTPDDVERWLRSGGFIMHRDPHSNSHFVRWLVTYPTGKQIYLDIFSDRDECLSFMRTLEPSTNPYRSGRR